MTGDDLKRMQDNFLETSKDCLLADGRLRPIGFVITLHKHVDKLFESGWGLEFLDPASTSLGMRDGQDDTTAVIVVDLTMDWKRLYHAVLNVFPKTRDVLPAMIALGESVGVDDVYKRTMRPFMQATQLAPKDVVAATMRQICGKVEAFATVYHSEAWLRAVDPSESVDEIYKKAPGGLEQDQKSVEVLISAMETYDFRRMITVPIQREKCTDSDRRDQGKILGLGEQTESLEDVQSQGQGRMEHLLKPLKEAS